MNGHRYTPEQEAFIKQHHRLPAIELTDRFNAKFGTTITCANIKGALHRRGLKNGNDGRFKPGNVPVNKGKKGHPSRSPSTTFKKGSVPPNRREVYAERIDKDGYIYIKAEAGFRKWRLKHRWLWERENGPVPDGYILRFIDGDKTNCDPSNLELITRLENLITNSLQPASAPDELIPAIRLTAKLIATTKKMEKQ